MSKKKKSNLGSGAQGEPLDLSSVPKHLKDRLYQMSWEEARSNMIPLHQWRRAQKKEGTPE